MDPKKAADEFFANLPTETESEPEFNFFKESEKPNEPEAEKPEKEPEEPSDNEPEEDDEPTDRKKPLRSERRSQKQREYYESELAKEREERIRMEERLKAFENVTKKEVDPNIKKLLYEVKDAEEGTEIFNEILSNMRTSMRDEILNELSSYQSRESEQVNEIYNQIESSLEDIEDRYGVDLTDDTETRNAFLDFVEGIAPEDSDELPNMRTAWKIFASTRKAGPSATEEKKAIASRAMVRSSASAMQNRGGAPEGAKPVSFDNLNSSLWSKIIGRNS